MLNRVVLIGRLTRDPELRFTSAGLAVAKFNLAVDRNRTNKEGQRETDFINITVFGKPAESCAEYLSKGKIAAIDGRLQISQYEDKDGQKRTSTDVIADNVRFLSPKGPSGSTPSGVIDLDSISSEVDAPGDDLPF
jgi:single-strand DNA-binding protein